MKYLLVAITLIVIACHNGNEGAPGPAGPTGPVTTIPSPPNLDTIADVVQEYNETRVAQGQDPVTVGLACSLYTVPNTTTAIIGATLTGVGSWTYIDDFDIVNGPSSPGVSVLPAPIQGLYTSYYIIKCTGLFIVPTSGYYEFDLASDDGANLYVNGLLINNDGVHGIQQKSATRFLTRGAVSFELDYLDAGGSHALVLASNGVPVPAANFYH